MQPKALLRAAIESIKQLRKKIKNRKSKVTLKVIIQRVPLT